MPRIRAALKSLALIVTVLGGLLAGALCAPMWRSFAGEDDSQPRPGLRVVTTGDERG